MNPMFLAEVMDYTKPIEGLADRLSFGGMMVLLGLGTVFAVLIVILISLYLFKVFFHDIPAKKQQNPKPVAVAPVTEVVDTATDDGEIIAVIAAAIAMAEEECSGSKFRVVSFRRV